MKNNELYEKLKETRVSREEIFKGHIVHLVRDDITLPNGAPAKREVCLHNGAVCVVPVTDAGEIIMERQFRYPFDEVMACGAFTQGSTIELSADAPVIEPYTLFIQGGLTPEYGRLSILLALTKVLKDS